MAKGVGIDFGTTNTVVSYVEKDNIVKTLRVHSRTSIPTVVYFLTKNEYVIGNEAKNAMKLNANAGICNFKTTIGDSEKFRLIAENGDLMRVNSMEVAKLFFNRIIKNIEQKLLKEFGAVDGQIGDVVITVPAKYNDTQKEMIKKAAIRAGFDSIKLVIEPTAAAVAFREENHKTDKSVLVYDMGGGTFDVSIIQEKNGQFIEIATGGEKNLGGNKITYLIAQKICELISDEYGITFPLDFDEFDEDDCDMTELQYNQNRHAIIECADAIKEDLSEEVESDAVISLIIPSEGNVLFNFQFTRDEFDELVYDDIKLSMNIVKDVIKEAKGKDLYIIDNIVLAGGSSQIVLIQKLFKEIFNMDDVVYADDVITAISRGAALLSKDELGDKIKPITSIQYGIALTSGSSYRVFSTIVHENMELPHICTRTFSLSRKGQDRIEIPYFERDIKTYPNAKRIDDDGILQIDTIIIENLPTNLSTNVVITLEFNLRIDSTFNIGLKSINDNGKMLDIVDVVQYKKSIEL